MQGEGEGEGEGEEQKDACLKTLLQNENENGLSPSEEFWKM